MGKFFIFNELVIYNNIRNFSNRYKDFFFQKKTGKFEFVLALSKSTYCYPTRVFPEGENNSV